MTARRRLGWPARPPAAASTHAESTLSELAWGRRRRATVRWAVWGAVAGTLAAVVAFAPAAWLARALDGATQGRLLLADARGSVWSGDAVLLLAGGPGSRDATALPGRLAWTLRWRGATLDLTLRHACCLNGDVTLRLRPGWAAQRLEGLPTADGVVGQWPAAWLAGLGTPWNTLQLGGAMRLASPGWSVEWADGRTRLAGRAQLDLLGASSRLSTLDPLGSYSLSLASDAAAGAAPTLTLTTVDGALRLSGQGQLRDGRLRFNGQAQAAAGSENALNNLLNIIGRRQGAVAVITIG